MLLRFLCLLCLITTSVNAQTSLRKAQWISPGYVEDSILRSPPIFKKTFTLGKAVASATLSVTAHGVYEAYLGGTRVGDAYFTPGWTSYNRRLQYQVYDVAALLRKGLNSLQVTVGEGWYRGAFGGNMDRDNYGYDASLLCLLSVKFKDGTSVEITSDDSWSCATGPIRHSDIYGGEIYDANVQPVQWGQVVVGNYSKEVLVPTIAEPVRRQETFKPVRILHTPAGEQVIDFGQNMAGWVRLKVKGHAGDTIKLYHAEVLDKAGNFYNGNLREATALDRYILKGNGAVETFEPHFTWHGFRYVKVEGCDAASAEFTAVALYSDLERTGSFSCSNPMINQLQHNIEWSLKSNFLDIPTDCPQRSERLGWTGDSQVFFPTAAFNYNVDKFYTKWLADLAVDQKDNGSVPNVIPNIYHNYPRAGRNGVAGWGDAAVIIPWEMYWLYGDTAILRTQYNSMRSWVGYIRSVSQEDRFANNGYGDWLAPGDSTSLLVIDQCFWAHSTQLLINTAAVLGYQDDVQEYTALLQKIKAAFLANYTNPNGTVETNTQTAYVLALEMDMLPDSLQTKAAAKLAALVQTNNNHLATGFLGTPHLLHALSKHGYADLAYALLNQDTYPSWLYPVKMGATTIWEKWNAILPDSSVQETSFNHYSYGAAGDWLYKVVAGINPVDPGYKKIIIKPITGGGLTWAKASYKSPYGTIISNWEIKNDKILMHVEVPTGTNATIYVPGKTSLEVGAGKYDYEGVIAPAPVAFQKSAP